MARWLLVLAIASACSRASEESEAKQWAQTPPPGKDTPPPKDLKIEVVVDGAVTGAITAETLRTTKADFTDAERSAWLIPTLVPAAGPKGTTVEAVSPGGVSVKFAHPTAEGFEAVLFLTRRGEIVVSALDPKDPFPRYHGQGGRLHRAGDSLPRVTPVARLEVTHVTP